MAASILITGANGQLGQALKLATQSTPCAGAVTFSTRHELDLTTAQGVSDFFRKQRFDVIVNCAAYTAVDDAEGEQTLVDRINHLAVAELADIAKQQDALLIQLSTDYVFDGQGTSPYTETDTPAPQTVYGRSKLAAEQAIAATGGRAIIIRTGWLYSEFGHNFLRTVWQRGTGGGDGTPLKVVCDQIGTPTYAHNLAVIILTMIEKEHRSQHHGTQLYHYSDDGTASWYDFAVGIFEAGKIACPITPVATADYPTAATRPHYSVLDKSKIKQALGITIPHWQDALKQCVAKLAD